MSEKDYKRKAEQMFQKNTVLINELEQAKEIIREYMKATESWNYDFADILKCNKKAEAFLNNNF